MRRISLILLTGCLLGALSLNAQESGVDSTGLPGDQFSLQGALELFKKAESPEAFEKMLNEEGNHVNNLDLNGDGNTDYVRVVDHTGEGTHALVLQVLVSEKETQDIAVIELEKTGDEQAAAQIIGDEDIFGEQVIIEPEGESGQEASLMFTSANSGPAATYGQELNGLVVNVWFWPGVRFLYGPAYRPWVSPWRWGSYPGWWKPWRPFGWAVYRPWHTGFCRGYVVVHTHRVFRAHKVYMPFRSTSVIVHTRHAGPVNHYRVTRTTVIHKGPGPGRGRNGRVVVRKRKG